MEYNNNIIAMTPEEIKKHVIDKIEEYHQKNYYNIHPAGRVREWIHDAVVENIAIPLMEENARLKQQLQEFQSA